MAERDLLDQASAIALSLEQAADQLKPDVIRAARRDATGQKDLDRIEYALGTIGKALILTDYSIDEEKDMDKLKAFREAQQSGADRIFGFDNRLPTGDPLGRILEVRPQNPLTMLRVEHGGQFNPACWPAASVGDAFEVTVALDRLLAGPGFGRQPAHQPATKT